MSTSTTDACRRLAAAGDAPCIQPLSILPLWCLAGAAGGRARGCIHRRLRSHSVSGAAAEVDERGQGEAGLVHHRLHTGPNHAPPPSPPQKNTNSLLRGTNVARCSVSPTGPRFYYTKWERLCSPGGLGGRRCSTWRRSWPSCLATFRSGYSKKLAALKRWSTLSNLPTTSSLWSGKAVLCSPRKSRTLHHFTPFFDRFECSY